MALTKEEINRKMTELFHEVEDITKVDGVDNLPGCEGMLIYEEPLIGFASADDPLFEEYKKPHVIQEFLFRYIDRASEDVTRPSIPDLSAAWPDN